MKKGSKRSAVADFAFPEVCRQPIVAQTSLVKHSSDILRSKEHYFRKYILKVLDRRAQTLVRWAVRTCSRTYMRTILSYHICVIIDYLK